MAQRAILSLAVVALTCSGCGKKATEPQVVGYTIYVAVRDWPNGQVVDPLYFIDADSLTIYDSIPRANAMWDIAASPDGYWLYTVIHVGRSGDSLRKIDVRSKQTVWTIPSKYPVDVNLLDNGTLLMNGPDELVRTSDGAVVERFDDSLQRRLGPVAGTKVAAVRKSDFNFIYGTDVVTGEVWGGYQPRLSTGEPVGAWTVRLHPDGRRVLVIGPYGGFRQSALVVGDLQTDETLLAQRLYSPIGEIALNEDGTMALAMDPGRSGLWEGPTVFAVVDLVAGQSEWLTYLGGWGQGCFIPGNQTAVLAPLPDYWTAPAALPVIRSIDGGYFGKIEIPLPEPLIGAIGVGPRLSD